MENKLYAVIDTNIIVSALISSNLDSNPVKVFRAIIQEQIVPVYNDEILAEYRTVLSREKFHLTPTLIDDVLIAIVTDGIDLNRTPATDLVFPDPKDIVFYEVALSKEGTYLVTGNIKHFPVRTFVITPAEMIRLLEKITARRK